jgi:GNAT superfamily N-acetyltransferase
MEFRLATKEDIPQIQEVRHSVTENVLSNPGLVTDEDCVEYLTKRGRGWVCVQDDKIVGFAIADLVGKNIWALFVRPEFEKKGIGKKLHELMMDWYFSQSMETVWLGTAPATRAAAFYKKAGWKEAGLHGKRELKFEMSREEWKRLASL